MMGGMVMVTGMASMHNGAEEKAKGKTEVKEPEKPDIFAGFGDLTSFKKNKAAPNPKTAAPDNPFDF